jgi:DNA-binding MarR family transcriptional regulator/GNAT superfamily N-acetyltransferase
MSPPAIGQVRRFNRLVTQRAGALDDHFLGRDRSLGASRLLYEIGPEGADLRGLRRRLGLDSGYVSRLVAGLERKGLVKLSPGEHDRRVRLVRWTSAGRREVAAINRRSDRAAAQLLEALPSAQRDRLVAAMAEVTRLLQAAGLRIERVSPAGPVARWCVAQYFEELDRRFESGFDPAAAIPIDAVAMIPPKGAFLIGRVDGQPVACGGVRALEAGVGYLKRMWVAESMRGVGLGKRMLEALEQEARSLGFQMLRLETNRALPEAIRMYRSAGYHEIPAFNDEPYGDHWFEKSLS